MTKPLTDTRLHIHAPVEVGEDRVLPEQVGHVIRIHAAGANHPV